MYSFERLAMTHLDGGRGCKVNQQVEMGKSGSQGESGTGPAGGVTSVLA
jgi:hypothetical protein